MPIHYPIAYLDEKERKRVVDDAVRVGYEVGAKYIKAPKLVDRPANPKDFNLEGNTFTWTVTTDSNGKAVIVDRVLDDDEVIVIYGLANKSTSPTINRITFASGSETVADIFFEDMYVHDVPEIVFDKPIVYTPKSRMVITIWSTKTGTSITEALVPKAVVVEKEGKTISRPE